MRKYIRKVKKAYFKDENGEIWFREIYSSNSNEKEFIHNEKYGIGGWFNGKGLELVEIK